MATILLQQQAQTYAAARNADASAPSAQTLAHLSQPAVALVLKAQAGQSYRLVDSVTGQLVVAKSIQRDGRRVIVELDNDNSVEIDDFFTPEGKAAAPLELVTGTNDALCPAVVTPSSVSSAAASDTPVVLWTAGQASELCLAPVAVAAAMTETAAGVAAASAAGAAGAGAAAGAAAGAGLSAGWIAAAGLGLAAAAGGGGGGGSTPAPTPTPVDPQAQALAHIQSAAQNNSADSSTPSLATYAAAGVTGVNADNLSAINNALNTAAVDGTQANTTAKVQALVDGYQRILSEANGSAADDSSTQPSAADYTTIGADIGAAATDPENLALLNSIVGEKTAADVSTVSQINALSQMANAIQSTAAGDSAAPALTVADLAAIGLTGVTADNLQAITQAIAAQADDGSGTASVAQLQALVQKVNDAQTAIATGAQDNSASHSTLPLSTYTDAGVSGVTADNQTAIETALKSAQVQGADVSTSAQVQALVDAYNRILTEANGTAADTTADPSAADYARIGVTGVDSAAKATLLNDAIGDKLSTDVDSVAEVQALADAVTAVMEAASSAAPTGPTLAQLQALGMTGVTADNLAGVQQALANTADDGTGVDTLAELQALVNDVNTAANSISAAAQANNANATTPSAATYASAGVTGVSSDNLAAVNNALNSAAVTGTSVDTPVEIQALVNSYNAILAEANGSATDATPADPSAADYTRIGVTGVDTTAKAELLGDVIGNKVATEVDTVAEVQTLANAVTSVMTAAAATTPTGPTLAELQALGIVGVTGGTLSAVQQAIANTANDGTGVDTVAELQALVDGVIAPVSAISNAAQTNSATATSPSLSTYANAGVTGVTSGNLAAVNDALNSAAVVGTSVDTTAEIQSLVNSYAAILAEANGATADATPADPSISDYANIGVTGVNSAVKATLLGDVIGEKNAADVDTVAEVQTLANAVASVMTAAAAATPTGPTLAELQALGLTGVTADNLASVQKAIAGTADDGTGADSVAELQALVNGVNTAVNTISAAAQANNATATTPTTANYATAGVTGVTSGNLASVNDALNSAAVVGTSVDTPAEIQTLVNSYAAILAEANGATADATPADPSMSDYSNIGVTGVNSAVKAALLGDVIGDKNAADVDTVAEVQTLADAVGAVMTAAAATTPTGPTLAQLQALGLTGVTADNLASVQKAIAGTADDGTGADSVAELQALVNGVNTAVNTISAAAQANNATATTPTTANYATAGVTGVTSGNLAAVNDALNSAAVVGTSVDTPAEIQTLVNSYAAILGEANGSTADATPADPSAADYTHIGVTGVDSATKAALLGDVIGEKNAADVDTVAEVQALANAVASVMTAAAAATPTGPTLAELQALGLTGVTADNLASVQKAIAGTADDGTGTDSVAELQALVNGVNTAVNTISTAAQANNATATTPTTANYATAGVTGVTSGNLAAVNDALNSAAVTGTSVDTPAEIQSLVNSYAAILAEANGSTADATPADPSAADYANIGANIGAAATDAENLALLSDIVGDKVAADVDTIAEINALAVIANAIALTAADGTPSPALTVADLQKAGLANVTTSNLANVLAGIAAKNDNGSETDSLAELQAIVNTAAPTTTVSTLSLSQDSGLSNSDFITKDASPTVSGTLSANTAAGEKVQISLDNGSTWVDASHTVGTNTFSLATSLTASNTLQARVVDARNNAAPVHSQAYVFDTTAPTSAVDLDSATGTQASSSQTVNAGDWQSGVQIATGIQAPTSTDIHALKITLGGAGLVGTDHLLLDNTDVALGTNSTGSNLTIGGVSGLSYSYNSSTHELTLTQAANAAFDPSKVDDILQTLHMRSSTMAEASPGDRSVTIAYQDMAGNDSTSATSTVSVIPVAQMSTVSLIQSQLATEVTGAETVTAYNTSGSFYFERNSNTNWNAQNTWAQGKTYDAADGSTQQMHLVHVNTGVESTALRQTPVNTTRNDSFFMGETDWNKDGTWEYNYSGNSQANQVSQAFFQKGNATDTTPWGNYSQWNSGEPGTDPVETISAVSSGGGWIDWGPNNNADAIAELEYSRVLNLAKTSNQGSIDVASSTAGTAYLVKSTATITDVASITHLDNAQWNSVAVGSSGILSYEDFSHAPKGWTNGSTAITSGLSLGNNFGLNGTLGRFGNTTEGTQEVSKTYTGLPANTKVWIEFDMLELDNWQGQSFNVYVNGVLTVATQYFGTGNAKDAWDGGFDMGNVSDGSNGGNANSALKEEAHRYAIQATTDANGQVQLGFGMSTSSSDTHVLATSEASWSIDNMTIRSTAGSDSSSLSLAGLENGTYVLYTADANGHLSRNATTTVNITSPESTIGAAADANNANSSTVTLNTYSNAGVTGVTSGNLASVNDALNSAAVTSSTLDTTAKIQAMVDSYTAILAEANGSTADATPADPSAADYTHIGVTGVDSATKAALLGDVIGDKNAADVDTVAEVQTLADTVGAVMTAAATATPTGPTLAQLQALGLTGVTADNLASVQKAIAGTADDGTGADSVAELQALVNGVNTAVNTISAAAQANNATATTPGTATYASAGVTGITSGNLAAVNDALNSAAVTGTSVDTPAEIQALVNSYAAILAEANGATADATPADPSAADYANIGANIGAAATDTENLALLSDILGEKVAADVDTIAEINALAVIANAIALTAADGTPSPALTVADLQKAGLANVTTSNLANVLAGIAAKNDNGSETDSLAELQAIVNTAAPNTTVSTLSLSQDSGLSNSDFITHDASQTVSGTLSANTAAGEKVQISLDNGSTWVDATHSVGTNTFSLATSLTASNTLQARVVDARNNAAPVHNQAYVFDTTAPTSAVDLDSATGTQASSSQTVNAGDWQSGVQIAANVQAPTSTDIHALKITLGGAGLVGTDHLLLDNTDVALGTNSTGSNLTIGGVSGLSYSYNSTTHELMLTQAANAAFDPSKVDDILQTLHMRSSTMAEATPGDRNVTIAYQDMAGNDSASATSTVSVIPVAQMSTVSLIQSQLTTEANTGEQVTANNSTGSFYFDRNSHANWNAQNTWSLGKTYNAADGSTQQMHLVHINSSVESSAVSTQQNGSNDKWNYFMGATDWDNDGTWNFTYDSGNSNLGVAFYNRLATGADVSPSGNYTLWRSGEPNGGEQVATITKITGDWFDWWTGNTADAIAELEYSRVLNLAKTNNLGSIDVASSTAGTAYLVKSTATVTDVASITQLDDSQWNSVAVGSSGILSYEDFSRAPKGWSQSNTDLTGTLGRFGNTTTGTQEVSKTYTGLPANTTVWIEFDMLELDNWQGQSFNVYVNDTLTVATQYFGTGNAKDAWDGGLDMGNVSDGSNGGNANSALKEEAHRYAIQATTDANGQIQLGFGMSTSSSDTHVLATSEASWSIDNMTIRSTAGSDTSSLSLAGLENGTYVLYTADANGHLSRNATTTVKVEPSTTVKTLALSADTGVSSTDFITHDTSQTVSGTLSANTAAGEKVQISLDNGSTWVDATHTVGTNTFSLATTLTASNTLQARIVDSTNNVGTSLSQAYVLDTSAPAAVDLSANTGTQATATISVKSSTTTSSTVSIAPDIQAPTDTDISTLSVTVGSAGLDTANDKLRLDGSTDRALSANFSASNVNVGGISGVSYSYDSTTRALSLSKNGGGSFTAADVDNILSGISLRTTSTTEGARNFTIGYTDVAGNTSPTATATVTIDNTAPTVTASSLSFSADTGNSSADRITQTAAQTVSGTLSANTATGDTVQISMDNGSTWMDATHTVGSNTFSHATTLTASNTAQVRVVDAAGNTGTANSYAYVLDTTAPTSAVDLSATADTQATSAQTVNASDWASGVSIAPALQAPTSADITALKLTLGGAQLDNSNDRLQVGSNHLTVGTSANGSNQTIGGVAGLDYSYDSSTHVLSITQAGNAAFDPTKIDDILQSLKLKASSIDTATTGDRTATFAWTDLAGNEATSATASISVIPVAQASSVSLIQTQLASTQTAAEKVTADSTQGSFYMDRNFAANYWNDQQTWANGKSLVTAAGNATLHLVHVNTSAESSAIYNLQNGNDSTVKSNLFLGATDNNVDGIWDWQYTGGVTQAFYSKNNTDTTPYGGFANWAPGEPGGGTETIAVYNMTTVFGVIGTWFDWGNSSGNNADAIAELEYARVLNLAKTTTSAVASQSLDVASSTTGTAYLVNSSVNVTDVNSITTAAGSKWNSVAVSNTILSYEDFNQTPTGWSLGGSGTTSTVNLGSTNGLNSVLGRVANTQEGAQTLSKTYALGLASTEVWVEFDMIEMDAWKGQNFNVFINGNMANSAQYFGSDLSTADAWDGGIDLGNLSTVNANTALKEEAHHYALKATTDASGNLVLGFGMSATMSSATLVTTNDASFGIDNVTLRKTSSASLSLAGLDAGTYQLYTADTNGHLSHNYSTGLLIG